MLIYYTARGMIIQGFCFSRYRYEKQPPEKGSFKSHVMLRTSEQFTERFILFYP